MHVLEYVKWLRQLCENKISKGYETMRQSANGHVEGM
jgi:hypothetical protein